MESGRCAQRGKDRMKAGSTTIYLNMLSFPYLHLVLIIFNTGHAQYIACLLPGLKGDQLQASFRQTTDTVIFDLRKSIVCLFFFFSFCLRERRFTLILFQEASGKILQNKQEHFKECLLNHCPRRALFSLRLCRKFQVA